MTSPIPVCSVAGLARQGVSDLGLALGEDGDDGLVGRHGARQALPVGPSVVMACTVRTLDPRVGRSSQISVARIRKLLGPCVSQLTSSFVPLALQPIAQTFSSAAHPRPPRPHINANTMSINNKFRILRAKGLIRGGIIHYPMSLVSIKAKLLKWGNSYGLRVARQDVERLRLKPGREVEVKVEVSNQSVPVSRVRSFHLGGRAADEHDAVFESSVASEHAEDES